MTERTFTRQDDWDADLNRLMYDTYMDLAEAGECTREEALKHYLAHISTQTDDLPPAA